VLSTYCNALKMGTESTGGFNNIAISNCVVYDTRLSGIALEIVDGGTMAGVCVSNIAMNGVGCPIFVRLGNRARPYKPDAEPPGIGVLRNVTISNIEAVACDATGCSITGMPGHPAENISLDHVRLRFPGGNDGSAVAAPVPEAAEKYPEFKMFGGPLPAYGFYCRHAKNVSFSNVEVAFDKPDARPALVCDAVDLLDVTRLTAAAANPRPAVLWLVNT
jgi:polygalacturonase